MILAFLIICNFHKLKYLRRNFKHLNLQKKSVLLSNENKDRKTSSISSDFFAL